MNNIIDDNASVNWLFLDLNSFFASCEQQEQPALRGQPVAIVQMLTDSTCAIAASYEAKALGIKTGTAIWEAKKLCPEIRLVKARHKLYVQYHHRIIEAVNTCLPVEKVCSIDEMACRLMGRERDIDNAKQLAHKVKRTIKETMGEHMRCSVGLAPNMFLSKVATDMQKPDGLVTITKNDLPHKLHRLELTDIYGIGARMEHRLHQGGIGTVEELMNASRQHLRQIWGGIYGVLYYELLHGADLQFPSSALSKSISHQHVLEPALRTVEGAHRFSEHLLAKAAERLRHTNYYCRKLAIFMSSVDKQTRVWEETGFHETQDTGFLLARLHELWKKAPLFMKPKKVGIVLLGLTPAAQHQPDLFAENAATGNKQSQKLSPLIDKINRKHGRGIITFGQPSEEIKQFTGHAAFQRVPEEFEF